MVLIDTNVILALLNDNDDHYADACEMVPLMRREGLVLVLPVLAEVTHFFERPAAYTKLERLLAILNVRMVASEHLVGQEQTLTWLKKYATHKPDYADAHLVLLTAVNKTYRVWSYDHEFRTIWRRPDGSSVPVAVEN
jgi:predicted nucleic acid-binding protein